MSALSPTPPDVPIAPHRYAAALRHRNFRLFWIGTLVSNSGDWLDQVALNWLIISSTGSALDLGLVNLCRAIPIFLFMLLGGAIADRAEQRRLLFTIQLFAMLLAGILAIMVVTGFTPIWALMLLALLRGSVQAFNLPARHSLIAKLVPRQDLSNAIALNSVTINLTKVIGPLIASVVIAGFGIEACFWLNVVSFLAVLWTLAAMNPLEIHPRSPRDERLGASIVAGLRYIAADSLMLLLVLASLVPIFVGQPFITLLAVYAHDALDWGPVGLGILTSTAGAGSVAGALMIATLGAPMQRGKALLLVLLGFGLSLVALALNPLPLLAPLIVFAAGLHFMCYVTAIDTMLHMLVPQEFRGRLMSTVFLNRGLVPLGTATAAALAGYSSITTAYLAMGILLLLFALLLTLFSPRLRRLRV